MMQAMLGVVLACAWMQPQEPAAPPAEPAPPAVESPEPAPEPGAVPTVPELSEEMKQRLREAGIDPDTITRPGTGAGMPGMPGAGMGAPGMGAPGMGAPGMGAPGMGAAGIGAPGIGAPGGQWGAPAAAPAPAAPSRPLPPDEPALAASEAKEVLLRLQGAWDLEVREFNGQPEAQSVTSGRSAYEMVLGGRFIRESFEGEMGGRPVIGIGYTGFDTQRSYFTMCWLDSSTAAITTALGTWNAQSETITFAGTYGDGPGAVEIRVTFALKGDELVYTLGLPGPAGESKMSEIVYRRAE